MADQLCTTTSGLDVDIRESSGSSNAMLSPVATSSAEPTSSETKDQLLFSTGVDLTKFAPFLKLPKEIQAMLWKITCQRPRFLTLYRHNKARSKKITDYVEGYLHLLIDKRSRKAPPILHASQTARAEGLRFYEKFTFNTYDLSDEDATACYIAEFDILFLHQNTEGFTDRYYTDHSRAERRSPLACPSALEQRL